MTDRNGVFQALYGGSGGKLSRVLNHDFEKAEMMLCANALLYIAKPCLSLEAIEHNFHSLLTFKDDRYEALRYGIRDDVENGVKVRQWQPSKGERPLHIGVNQKQKAKNRAARKRAKQQRRRGA